MSNINGNDVEKEIILELDEIRKNKTNDEKMLVLTHEIGHALAYAVLFNTPPKQINTNSSGLSSGFVVNHDSVANKTFIKDKIVILMAGLVAEELVFGEEFKSGGASMDIVFATDIASKYVRDFGMDGTISSISLKNSNSPYRANYDIDSTNIIIENMLIEGKTKAKDLLNKYLNLYKKLVKFGVDNSEIKIEQFLDICNQNGLNLVQKEINEKIIYSYDEKLNNFLK